MNEQNKKSNTDLPFEKIFNECVDLIYVHIENNTTLISKAYNKQEELVILNIILGIIAKFLDFNILPEQQAKVLNKMIELTIYQLERSKNLKDQKNEN